MLEEKEYLIEETFTAIDIAFYNEIKTVQALSLDKIDEDKFADLADWFQRMSEVEEIEDIDEALYDVIEKYELDWRLSNMSEIYCI